MFPIAPFPHFAIALAPIKNGPELEGDSTRNSSRFLWPMSQLFVICAMAFVVVMVVLALLASIIHGISLLFPGALPPDEIDPTTRKAIEQAVAKGFPGARLASIEKENP